MPDYCIYYLNTSTVMLLWYPRGSSAVNWWVLHIVWTHWKKTCFFPRSHRDHNSRFHPAAQRSAQFKIAELFVGGVFHLLLLSHGWPYVSVRLWRRGGYYVHLPSECFHCLSSGTVESLVPEPAWEYKTCCGWGLLLPFGATGDFSLCQMAAMTEYIGPNGFWKPEKVTWGLVSK